MTVGSRELTGASVVDISEAVPAATVAGEPVGKISQAAERPLGVTFAGHEPRWQMEVSTVDSAAC